MTETPIQRAIRIVGSRKALASAIPVNLAMVWQWENGKRPVPPKYAKPIERATSKQVTRYEIAPEVFGAPRKQRKAS